MERSHFQFVHPGRARALRGVPLPLRHPAAQCMLPSVCCRARCTQTGMVEALNNKQGNLWTAKVRPMTCGLATSNSMVLP